MSELWASAHMYCPACGAREIKKFSNNRPVADFFCGRCDEEFELKSQSTRIGRKIPDGAYSTMIQRITSEGNPNFLLLRYDKIQLNVIDLEVIPKHFFYPSMIERRKALGPTARRAGWEGCNIVLDNIPSSGRIALVRTGNVVPRHDVRQAWERTLFLRDQNNLTLKSWLLNIMRSIERLGQREFSLRDLYASVSELKVLYPNNLNIEAKIRQQLQILRDHGRIEFLGRGHYRVR